MRNILFKKDESFSDKDKNISICFLYCGEEYVFSYYNINNIKKTSIINKNTYEIIYMHYIDNKKKRDRI